MPIFSLTSCLPRITRSSLYNTDNVMFQLLSVFLFVSVTFCWKYFVSLSVCFLFTMKLFTFYLSFSILFQISLASSLLIHSFFWFYLGSKSVPYYPGKIFSPFQAWFFTLHLDWQITMPRENNISLLSSRFSFSLVFLRVCARVFIFSNIATLNVTIQKWRFQILCFYFFFQKFFTKKVSTKFSNQTDEKLFFKVNLPLHFNSFSFRFHSVKNTNFEWFVLFYLN
jgi:hypothetical protein